MRITRQNFLAAILSLGLLASSCSKKPTPLDQSPASAQLKHFIAEKKAQATAAAAAEKQEMLPEFKTIFAAAEKGDSQTVSNSFEDLKQFEPKYSQTMTTAPATGFSISKFVGN